MGTILVIDDEPGIRALLCTLLEQKGYDVLLAENGSRGLTLFRREQPQLIVLDLKMPGMDGVFVLEQVRKMDPRVPVIVFTGAGTDEVEARLREFRADAVIPKEFSLHRLGDILKRLAPLPADAGTKRLRPAYPFSSLPLH